MCACARAYEKIRHLWSFFWQLRAYESDEMTFACSSAKRLKCGAQIRRARVASAARVRGVIIGVVMHDELGSSFRGCAHD